MKVIIKFLLKLLVGKTIITLLLDALNINVEEIIAKLKEMLGEEDPAGDESSSSLA